MAGVKFDDLLETAKEAGFGPEEVLTPGTYDAEVVVSSTKISKKGKRQFDVKFKVLGGPHDKAGVWHSMYISPESPTAVSITIRDLGRLGADSAFLKGRDTDSEADCQAIADKMLGAVVRIKVVTEPYNGEDQNKVKSISASSATPSTRLAVPPAERAAAPASPF